jgi:nicotinamidase-related amidase
MPGWDRFLTEQDKQHEAIWGKRGLAGFGTNPCVLVVDDYYAVVGLEREPILESIKTWPMSCGIEGWEAIDKTVELLAFARANGVPVIYVRGMNSFPSPWMRLGKETRSRRVPRELRHRANEIIEEVAPQPGELVLKKAAPSAFAGTPLQFHLQYEGIDTIIVCGETTSGCVRASVVDGCTLRFKMGVVEECCFDRTQASHWINLFDMHQKYADVIDRFQAARYFESLLRSGSAPVATPLS